MGPRNIVFVVMLLFTIVRISLILEKFITNISNIYVEIGVVNIELEKLIFPSVKRISTQGVLGMSIVL